jgi:hypothetical protein
MSVARSGDVAFACASELRPIFVRASLNAPLFPLASLYLVLARTTDVAFVTVRLPTFFLIFTVPVIWTDPEHAAPLQLKVTGATRVFPDRATEDEVMTTFGFVFDAAPAAPFDPTATRLLDPSTTATAIDIRTAQARACMNGPPAPLLMANGHNIH